MSVNQANQGFKFEGWHMLVIMVSFFAIIASVNVTMAILANSNWTGLVVKNSYVASQKYNQVLHEAEQLRKSGLRSELKFADKKLSFVLSGQDGAPVLVDSLTAHIGRPAHEHSDRSIAFEVYSNDRYQLELDLEPGIWAVSITGMANGAMYRRDERIFVNAKGEGSLE